MRLVNVRPNFNALYIGTDTVWFSYETIIAFTKKGKVFIRQNDWGPTTGKHLNLLEEDKSIRLSGDKFNKALPAKFK